MTHPGKNPGQQGYPTPNDIPEELGYIVFKFPNSNEFAGLLLGALTPLAYAYNYYQWGDLTPEETSILLGEIITQAPYNIIVDPEVPTPYWDDAEDSDDEDSDEDQDWYGEIDEETLEFKDQIAIWAIAGFIAYSGQIGAAISFNTFAPRFVLAFKKHGLGGAIRVFIDGVNGGLLDTQGDTGVLEATFVGNPENETHNILMFLESIPVGFAALDVGADVSAPMQVIRKRLSATEGAPPNTRYNPTCHCVETSSDGGLTWNENPGADPRINPAYNLPPSEFDKCAVAAGMVNLIRSVVDLAIDIANIVSLANALIEAIGWLIPVTWMIDLFFEVAGALAFIGSTLLEAAFGDGEAYDQLLCAFFTNLPSNGVATDDTMTAIRADIVADIDDPTVTATFDVVRLLAGFVGFNNSGVADADPDADCTPCCDVWEACADLLESNFDMEAPTTAWGLNSSWSLGVGWEAGINLQRGFPGEYSSFLRLGRLMPDSTYTRIEIDLDLVFGNQTVFPSVYKIKLGGEVIFNFGNTNQSGTVVWEGEITTSGGHLEFDGEESGIGYSNNGVPCGGSGTITAIRLFGDGCTPLPTFPCD